MKEIEDLTDTFENSKINDNINQLKTEVNNLEERIETLKNEIIRIRSIYNEEKQKGKDILQSDFTDLVDSLTVIEEKVFSNVNKIQELMPTILLILILFTGVLFSNSLSLIEKKFRGKNKKFIIPNKKNFISNWKYNYKLYFINNTIFNYFNCPRKFFRI